MFLNVRQTTLYQNVPFITAGPDGRPEVQRALFHYSYHSATRCLDLCTPDTGGRDGSLWWRLSWPAQPSLVREICSVIESSNPVPWDILEGCGRVAGTFSKEAADVYLCLIHVDGRQKPAQYCKTIILQIKNKDVFLKEPLCSSGRGHK